MLGYLWTPKLIVVEFWAGSQRLNYVNLYILVINCTPHSTNFLYATLNLIICTPHSTQSTIRHTQHKYSYVTLNTINCTPHSS